MLLCRFVRLVVLFRRRVAVFRSRAYVDKMVKSGVSYSTIKNTAYFVFLGEK
jgi:hypothetical protein